MHQCIVHVHRLLATVPVPERQIILVRLGCPKPLWTETFLGVLRYQSTELDTSELLQYSARVNLKNYPCTVPVNGKAQIGLG